MRMTRTLNKVMLIGNVGRDPELKYTPSGIPVSSFRLATTETWKDRDGNVQEHTEWHTIVAWRGLAEVIHKIVKKGARVYIEGKIHSRTYEDKNGQKKVFFEILADNMLMLEYKKSKTTGTEQDTDNTSTIDFESDFDVNTGEYDEPDDLLFSDDEKTNF